MTLSSETSSVSYNGNGLTSTFPFTFPIFERTHLVVTHIDSDGAETVLVENTNYTLTWDGSGEPGTVNRIQIVLGVPQPFPLPTGESLRIERTVPLVQQQDLVNQTRIRTDQIEKGLDYLTQITQQLNRQVGSADHASAHLPGGSGALPWTTIHGRGLAADRPAAGSTNAGYLYYSTDTGALERSDGVSSWETYYQPGATGPQGPPGPAGATDHGALTGLGDDDHTQYHTDARGDARYAPITHAATHLPNGTDPLTSFNQRGLLSARPAASAANVGLQYTTTDTGARTVTRSNGTGYDEMPVAFRDRWPLNPKDYGAIGDGYSHPLSDYYATLAAAQAVYPHATALTNEIDWAATQLCLNLAVANNRSVMSPSGKYLCDQTIIVGIGTLWCGEGAWNETTGVSRTEYKATTTNMLLCRTNSLSKLHDIGFNGDDKAAWGVHVRGANPIFRGVTVHRCTDTGICLDTTQNGVFYDLWTYYCLVGITFRNGARNNSFFGVKSSTNDVFFGGVYADSCWLKYTIIDTDVYGFGATLASDGVTTYGNDRNHFYGGIIEDTFVVVKTENPYGYSSLTHDQTDFNGLELSQDNDVTRGTCFLFDQSFTGRFIVRDCYIGLGDDDTRLGIGPSKCRLLFEGNTSINAGFNLALQGLTDIPSNLLSTMYFSLVDETQEGDYGGISGKYKIGVPTTSFDATTRRFTIGGGPGVVGVAWYPRGVLAQYSTSMLGITLSTIKVALRVNFTIDTIVGGSTVDVYTELVAAPWRRKIGSFGIGTHEVSIVTTGVEGGAFSFIAQQCSSFTIGNINIRSDDIASNSITRQEAMVYAMIFGG